MHALPQIIYLALMFLGMGVIAAKHGQPHKPYNFGATMVAATITIVLLAWGGFFAPLFGGAN